MSYNYDWWKNEQEVKGLRNWQEMSKSKKWYGCITKNKVQEDPQSGIYYDEFGDYSLMTMQIINYYQSLGYFVRVKHAKRSGFLQSGTFVIVPYIGQWGKGWLLCYHKEASTVAAVYILLEGGDPDGIANNYQ